MANVDLFGNEIIEDVLLRDKFLEPPFSILNSMGGAWQNRKDRWKRIGIKSELGRNAPALNIRMGATKESGWKDANGETSYTSIFDPALTELMYRWFCPDGGEILDPFAGGSVRGIVAHYLGYKYTGCELRQCQVDSNRDQAIDILPLNNQPQWYVGDSDETLSGFDKKFDFIFSCPPYSDLEVYSDLPQDLSNMDYAHFQEKYFSIIRKSCLLLKPGSFACFVVSEVRDKNGYYIGLIPDTIRFFRQSGLAYYNEAILLNSTGTAAMRAQGNMKSKKLVKVHQNVLIFIKP
jgi:hypothetical protein